MCITDPGIRPVSAILTFRTDRPLLVDEAHYNGDQGRSLDLQQALIESLATLSIPIIVKEEIDDNGYPFYIWHIGTPTQHQPFGLYVGIGRRLIDVLELALERLIKHMSQ